MLIKPSRLKDEHGMAIMELIPIMVILVILINYSLGFFGAIHTGILNSMAARNYAFDTFKHRSNLVYLRDTVGGALVSYDKYGDDFVQALRDKTGLDKAVSDYVLKTKEAKGFLKKYTELLDFLLPQYVREGKSYLNVGIGCTGGKHRSVSIAEELFKVTPKEGFLVSVKHRDADR